MTGDLFPPDPEERVRPLASAVFLLPDQATAQADELLCAIGMIEQQAPFRHMKTPGGHTMAVAMTNCGRLGWVSDHNGYRYTSSDPDSGLRWPALPPAFLTLARQAATAAGFPGFEPDACLVNRYVPGTRLSLHQDRNERDYDAPIVSVSLGMSAVFLLGGHSRSDRPVRVPLHHGDVMVWGREDRLRFHGVMPLKPDPHPRLGLQRINLTFRKAG